ncbi:hypothetical protein AB0N62_35545 [Streptomyces sp. NPDC093982]|uniref:hypothetical protein n=1 Tax=Streptomyces sp. NPDC093982 TaxID=3155077 RepID=UPI00341CDB9A
MNTRPAAPLLDTHPVPASVRELVTGIVAAVRAGNDPAIPALLARLAPVADTTTLLLLRYRLGLEDVPLEAMPQPRCASQ